MHSRNLDCLQTLQALNFPLVQFNKAPLVLWAKTVWNQTIIITHCGFFRKSRADQDLPSFECIMGLLATTNHVTLSTHQVENENDNQIDGGRCQGGHDMTVRVQLRNRIQ